MEVIDAQIEVKLKLRVIKKLRFKIIYKEKIRSIFSFAH